MPKFILVDFVWEKYITPLFPHVIYVFQNSFSTMDNKGILLKLWVNCKVAWSDHSFGPELPSSLRSVNTLRPRHNGRRFADDTFKRIFLNDVKIPIEISLKFVPKGAISNIPALVQIMAWRRPGDKPLSAPVMVSLMTHICVTRPQWVNICISAQPAHTCTENVFNTHFQNVHVHSEDVHKT